jgi:proline iminopeptidase
MRIYFFLLVLVATVSCNRPQVRAADSYLDTKHLQDRLSGGARMIPISTPKGPFRVWTKRIGNNPKVKVLLLAGGPGLTHEYLEAVDSYFPAAHIEYYYYDQLGSAYSDQPEDMSLWSLPRFVDEVEQVRKALSLSRDNFYLFGHSWGALLAMEYALKYPENLKALIVSNMMTSIPAYNAYANSVLLPQMDQKALQEIRELESKGDFENPRYMDLLIKHYYVKHLLQMPFQEWPDPLMRSFVKINKKIYTLMQGPSEMGAGGLLVNWDRSRDLKRLTMPTLFIGAPHDTMDPKHAEWASKQVAKGEFLYCPKGSHMAIYDDQEAYFGGLIRFIEKVNAGL